MSQRSHERLLTPDNTEVLGIIKEEHISPSSSVNLTSSGQQLHQENIDQNVTKENTDIPVKESIERRTEREHMVCPCKNDEIEKEKIRADKLEKMLAEKEEQLKAEFQQQLDKEMRLMKERFNFILQNEQTRATYMLREAHRERKEKIMALQRQLECKNLAGLMYVLASERTKSKMEILRITEEYTSYIRALQDLLAEGQGLILHLSRGYKTAARVDHEWRQKMQRVMREFQNFVYHFAGGTPETNQYFFDIPDLLKIKAPVVDNPNEDPCDVVDEEENVIEEEEIPHEKSWWEMLEGDERPFVVLGDMADFQPEKRREVLRSVKAAKTAPKKWKEYVFHDMFLKASCTNEDSVKNEYFKRMPPATPDKWDCLPAHIERQSASVSEFASRRVTTASIDIRCNMGSILKVITASNNVPAVAKTALLGARDSIEIASSTKLREKHKQSIDHTKVVLNVGSRRTSMFEDVPYNDEDSEEIENYPKEAISKLEEEEEVYDTSMSALGSMVNDSFHIATHVPEQDHRINYEKVCPMEDCQRLQVDSFIRSLPPYMRANPFTHFEQTYEEYEPCSPEQLEILKKRLEDKRKKEKVEFDMHEDNPLEEWTPSVEGVAVQTSEMSVSLPPCTCRVPSPTPASSTQRMFTLADLIPMKQELDEINMQCFFDEGIEFNRFKVIGQESDDEVVVKKKETEQDFRKKRLHDIHKVLKMHPSLCEIFQANIRC